MKKLITLFTTLALITMLALPLSSLTFASSHDADIAASKSCKYCGMDREKFAHSRMLIEFEDSSSVATCSLHCAAVDLANNIDKTPKAIKVADYGTKQLIDAEKAVWVIGGSKQGVMTRNAKWAFATKDKAEAFIKENGGKLATFDEAIKSAYEDMYTDTKMIRDKRKQMKMKQSDQGSHTGHNH
jgi:nitrous oxide reductase accessory protein NosL